MQRLLPLIVCLLCATATFAGKVVTRGGATYTGPVEFKADQIIITPPGAAPIAVPIKALSQLSMPDETPIAPTTAPVVSGPWQRADVGQVKLSGDASEHDGVFSLHGAGWGFWGGEDSGHLVYQSIDGDCDVIVHVGDFAATALPFQAGITLRQSLDATSPQACIALWSTAGPRINSRPMDDPRKLGGPRSKEPLHWLRLIRAGDAVSGFCSTDVQTWLPTGVVRPPLARRVFLGLTCAATANTSLAAATFDHVSIRLNPTGPPQGLCLTDGTLLAAKVKTFDSQVGVKYRDSAGKSQTLPIASVAYLFMRPLPSDIHEVIAPDKLGVLLDGGDLMEGEVQNLNDNHCTVSSLVLGIQNVPGDNVVMALLSAPAVKPAMTLSTRDGSVYRSAQITVMDGSVQIDRPLLGKLTFPAADVVEIKGAK